MIGGVPERRKSARIRLNLPITVSSQGQHYPSTLVDLSKGGVLFRCEIPVKLSDSVTLRFRVLPALDCRAQGNVRRYATHKAYGVAFAQINDNLDSFLDDLSAMGPDVVTDFAKNVMEPILEITAVDP